MMLTIKRTFKEALNNFWRNSWLTVASVSVLILSLYVASVIYVVTLSINGVLKNIEERVNVSVYLKEDASENDIMNVKNDLLKLAEVQSVNYVSRNQALENFKRDNANEPAIMQSLDEIGGNPLLASLVVKANSPDQYQKITDYINQAAFKEDVSRINYDKNKDIINKLNSIINTIRRVGIGLGIVFTLIAVLIIFNTVRITIYTHKQEIEVMRLVGASNNFIRLPFIFEGMLYGLIASIITMPVLFLTLRFVTPLVSSSIPPSILISYYLSNFFQIFGLQLFIGILLGTVSSMIAIRKYLQI